MRTRIKYLLQNSNLISWVYFCIGTLIIRFIGLFIKTQKRHILFVSYGGKQFSDSPKAIFDKMRQDKRFKNWRYTWAFTDPDIYEVSGAEKVKIDTLSYYIAVLQAKVWVTNSGIKRYLNFDRKKTIFINTWHGVPLKKIGIDEVGLHKSKVFARKWFEFSKSDITLAESKYDASIFKHIFRIEDKQILISGLPRNDELYRIDQDQIKRIKVKLRIPEDALVLLYAPTVRNNKVDDDCKVFLNPPIDFRNWTKAINNCVILFRAHYAVNKANIPGIDLPNVLDVTNYQDLNELMEVSDLLISDYSSIFFDYSILEKPMFCFAYDYDEYKRIQGLYLDPDKILPNGAIQTEAELLKKISEMNLKNQIALTKIFKREYLCGEGKATERVLNYIYQRK